MKRTVAPSFIQLTSYLRRQAAIEKGIHKLRVYHQSAVEESEARERGKGTLGAGVTVLNRAGREGLSDGEASGQRGACECGCVGNESLLGRGTNQCKGPEGSGCGEKQQVGQGGWSRESGGKVVREEVRGSSRAQLTRSPLSHGKETGFYSQWDGKPLESSEQGKKHDLTKFSKDHFTRKRAR